MAVHRTRMKARLAGAVVLAISGVGVTLTIPEGPALAAQHVQGTEIEKVIVEGNQRVEASTVLSYLTIKPGDVATSAGIDESLKALFATGLFADVQIERQGSDLLVKVVENPIINRVVFEGNKKLEEKDLNKSMEGAVKGNIKELIIDLAKLQL